MRECSHASHRVFSQNLLCRTSPGSPHCSQTVRDSTSYRARISVISSDHGVT